MGLDMYLTADKYVGGGYEHAKQAAAKEKETGVEGYWLKDVTRYETIMNVIGLDQSKLPESNYLHVRVEVGYWRKANAIHNWFVNNVQDGKDDCGSHYVDRDQLEELRDLCVEILSGVDMGEVVMEGQGTWAYETYPNIKASAEAQQLAEEQLPPASGFFFGGSEIDQWYFQYLKETADMLTSILENKELELYEFYYQSSW